MNRIQKYIVTAVLMSIMLFGGGITVYAAGVNITFSDPSGVVGNEVGIKMKIKGSENSALSKADVVLSYDSSMLDFVSGTSASGGAGTIRIAGSSNSTDAGIMEFTLTFKALQAGTAKIKITTQEVYDENSQLLTLQNQGTSTVTITALESYSNIADLKELIISPGTLEPAFSPTVLEYRTTVDGDVTKVAVSAIPKDEGKAKVTITGNDELVTGENTIECKVTAEDGSTINTYTLVVTKGEGSGGDSTNSAATDLQVVIAEEVYHIASSWSETSLPEGFERSTYNYQGQDIAVGKGLEKDLLLLYLINSSDQGAYYIYDEIATAFSPYVQLETTRKAIVILSPDPGITLPQGFVESSISIENQIVHGWVWSTETDHQYCIFYAMNWNGEKGFYRYDTKEKTLQRYFQDPAIAVGDGDSSQLSGTYQQLKEQYQRRFMIILVLIAVAVVLFIVTILLLFKKGKNNGRYERRYHENDDDDDDEDMSYSAKRTFNKKSYDNDQYFNRVEEESLIEKELEENLAQDTEEVFGSQAGNDVIAADDSEINDDDDDFEVISIDD